VNIPDYGTVLWSPGSRNGSRKAGKLCHFSTYLPRERELSLAHAQKCSLLIMEQCYGPLAVEMVPGKHYDFSTYLPRERELSMAHAQRCRVIIMEHCCYTLAVEMVPGKQEITAISALILPREREISLALAQKCSFLIMEQCCGSMAVKIIPGKHCDYNTNLTKRVKAQSGACAEVQFPEYGTVL
jgi:hypothetical protein